MRISLILIAVFCVGLIHNLDAQYFGRNKPRYRQFDFKVYETPNFSIHSYLDNKDLVEQLSQESEAWYEYYVELFGHEIPFRNPLIFYNNHAEFQQTNTIMGDIGIGTGGVTEGLKNRVIMPLGFGRQQTSHVLGHEMVHAFQFNMIKDSDSTSMQNLGNTPLWLIEGMAEHLSLGRVDPFTAMWMRNALIHDNIPALDKMNNPRYFPYRYGQAFIAFLSGVYGDEVIRPFFLNTAMYGLRGASEMTLQIPLETLSDMWINALKTHYEPFLGDKKESRIGKTILSDDNAGRMNISPSLSPNGRWVIFMSEKDLFTTDIFLADARSGEIQRKVNSLLRDSDLDYLNFLETSGTWSPDSRRFAFIGVKKGKNVIVIKQIEGSDKDKTFEVPGVPSFTHLTWSPDGKEIVFTGLVKGQTDLYSVNIRSNQVRQLTDDHYAELYPHFSADGSKLVFSYDKRSLDGPKTNGRWTFDLAVMDYSTGAIDMIDIFPGADNINPNYDHEGNIYFVSDRDGFRNLYRYMTTTGELFQMTDFLTGISGISRYSQAISSSRNRDRILFTHYFKDGYMIKESSTERLLNKPVDRYDVNLTAGTIPAIGIQETSIIESFLNKRDLKPSTFSKKEVPYRARFSLDYVGGGAGVGVANTTFGTFSGMQGGIDLLFGDMLGNNQLFGRLALNGELLDFGGLTSYINRKNRLAWGVGISHVPLRTGFLSTNLITDERDGQMFPAIRDDLNILRVFDKNISLFAHLPFSSTLRLEGGIEGGHRGFRWDLTRTYSTVLDLGGGRLVRNITYNREREKIDLGDRIQFNQFYTLEKGYTAGANIALVGDNSFFGLTSPLAGQRFRLSLEKSLGLNDYYAVLGDYRRYVWAKPFSFAVRGMSYIRFDEDIRSLYPFFIGQMGFVRGYDFLFGNSFSNIGDGLRLEQTFGSKMGLFSAEIRLPFTGPKRLSLIGSQFLFTDLALFFDAGMAFDEFSHIRDGRPYNVGGQTIFIKPELLMSAGLSVRVNLFGAMILEPYWAVPLQPNSRVVFGLNFIPGW